MLPIIAITADTLIDHSPMINQHNADMAPSPIKEAVLAAGGVPIIFPVPSSLEDVDVMVAALGPRLDGLILPGGPDVDPTTYGQEPQPQLGRTNYLKDAFEIALVKAALKAGKPFLRFVEDYKLLMWRWAERCIKIYKASPKSNISKRRQEIFRRIMSNVCPPVASPRYLAPVVSSTPGITKRLPNQHQA